MDRAEYVFYKLGQLNQTKKNPWYKTEPRWFYVPRSNDKTDYVNLNRDATTNLEDPSKSKIFIDPKVKTNFSNIDDRQDVKKYLSALVSQSELYNKALNWNNPELENESASTYNFLNRARVPKTVLDEYKNMMDKYELTPGSPVKINSKEGKEFMNFLKDNNLPFNYDHDPTTGEKRLRVQNEVSGRSNPQRGGFTGNFS